MRDVGEQVAHRGCSPALFTAAGLTVGVVEGSPEEEDELGLAVGRFREALGLAVGRFGEGLGPGRGEALGRLFCRMVPS